MKKMTFKNGTIDIAGNIHLPPSFDETGKYPAIIVFTPAAA
jgi:fermentation-respiration switch protein FrsA (DUF1100 family)